MPLGCLAPEELNRHRKLSGGARIDCATKAGAVDDVIFWSVGDQEDVLLRQVGSRGFPPRWLLVHILLPTHKGR